MTDIISARCFGCGNVIKVPAALGGKKARCPQCTNTISIPMGANDTQYNDIISDAELPEVARDLESSQPEEGDAPFPNVEKEPGTEEPDLKRRGGTSVRGRAANSGSSLPRVQPPRGTQPRYPAGKPPGAKSNSGMIVGIILGVLALVILAVVVGGNSKDKGKHQVKEKEREKDKEKDKTPPAPQYSADDQAIVNRLMDYTSAVSRGDVESALKFFAYDIEEQRKYRLRISEMVEKKTVYENVKVTSVGNGSVTFSYGAGNSKTIAWKKDGDYWLIAELPSP
jgi:hypothetical protein